MLSKPASSSPSNKNTQPRDNIQDLMQKPGEAIFPYFAQNVATCKRFLASKLDEMPQATQADNVRKQIYKNSEISAGHFFQTQMFITGAHPQRDHEVHLCQLYGRLRSHPGSGDHQTRQQGHQTHQVGENCIPSSEYNEDEIEAINAVLTHRGQPLSVLTP
jgi:hypothetical protein